MVLAAEALECTITYCNPGARPLVGLGRELGRLECDVLFTEEVTCTCEPISKLQQDFRLTHELEGLARLDGAVQCKSRRRGTVELLSKIWQASVAERKENRKQRGQSCKQNLQELAWLAG